MRRKVALSRGSSWLIQCRPAPRCSFISSNCAQDRRNSPPALSNFRTNVRSQSVSAGLGEGVPPPQPKSLSECRLNSFCLIIVIVIFDGRFQGGGVEFLLDTVFVGAHVNPTRCLGKQIVKCRTGFPAKAGSIVPDVAHEAPVLKFFIRDDLRQRCCGVQ